MHGYTIVNNSQKLIDRVGEIMCAVGKRLGQLGSVPSTQEYGLPRTSGNFSMRYCEGFVITASGVEKTILKPGELVFVYRVDHEQKMIRAEGALNPSIDVLVHDAIYRAHSSINAVLHTHDSELLQKGSALGIEQTSRRIAGASSEESKEIAELVSMCIAK